MAKLSCLRIQPRSFLGSIGVLLMSWKVNFQVVRTASQNSIGIFLLIMSSLDQTFCGLFVVVLCCGPVNVHLNLKIHKESILSVSYKRNIVLVQRI